MTINSRTGTAQWASTTGYSLIHGFKEGNKFRAPGKAKDRAGVPIPNEFTMVSVNEVKSNIYFTSLLVKTQNGTNVELHIRHNNRYTVPANQR